MTGAAHNRVSASARTNSSGPRRAGAGLRSVVEAAENRTRVRFLPSLLADEQEVDCLRTTDQEVTTSKLLPGGRDVGLWPASKTETVRGAASETSYAHRDALGKPQEVVGVVLPFNGHEALEVRAVGCGPSVCELRVGVVRHGSARDTRLHRGVGLPHPAQVSCSHLARRNRAFLLEDLR